MIKKRIIWGFGSTLLLVFVILLGLQYSYYQRVVSIRKEQTKQAAKDALSEVALDMEVQELIRYLSHELEHQPVAGFGAACLRTPERAVERGTLSWAHKAKGDKGIEPVDSLYLSERLMQTYLAQRNHLDEYILRHLYDQYSYDSIPQLINPRYLKEQVRLRLDNKGVCEAYSIMLCDAKGRKLYEFIQPGMLRRERTGEDVITQRIFVDHQAPNKLTPFLRLTLDFSPSRSEMLSFALPGLVSTFFVLLLGLFTITMLVRHLSFQAVKTSFINNMTHELKTPVSSIKLASSRLKDPEVLGAPEKRRRFLSIIEHETSRMQLLIDKVLQFSILDSKTEPMQMQEIELNEILLPIAEIYTAHAQNKGGDLTLDLEAYNTWVSANKVHLTNVIFNLLDNAVKYAHPERPLHLRVATENVDQSILIMVEDNGIGVPKESLKRIFERYYRVPTGHRHDVKGFGLGLAYVASVVKQFGGRITAENIAQGGTRMVIKLPVNSSL